jgi:tetratricopeptide (TPR) repeat protein
MRWFVLLVAALTLTVAARAEDAEPPFALTDPGGQGLDLEKLEVRVAAHGPLALTELDMTFRNPQDRRIEGKLVCALPTGATVSRFAKEVDGKLMEGEVVERLRATQVYTEILHTMQDPALLEQDQGNRFRARIFPIAPKAAVRILLSYTSIHAIGGDGQRKITVPLRGMSKIGLLKLLAICRPLPGEAVQLADASGEIKPILPKDRITFAEEMERKDFTPKEDLVLAFRPGTDAKPAARLVAGDFQVAMFRPAAAPAPEAAAKPASVRVLIDTSASQAASGAARLKALARILDFLGEGHAGIPFTVEAFDLDVAPLLEYKGGETKGSEVVAKLEARRFLGATDISKVLKHAGERARESKGAALVVLVSDGIATMGTKETGDLVRALGEWPATARLHVLAIGPVQDAPVTAALAEAGRGRVVTLPLTTAWEENAKLAVAELARPRGPDYQAYDEAAEWMEPRKFPDAVPGGEIITFSRRKPGAAAEVGVTAGKGTEMRADGDPLVAPEFAALLEREAYRAQLAMIEREENATEDKAKRAELRAKRVEISTKHRVLCPLTSMLVLESESEYAKYGIDRRALADVMVVGKKGIELLKREPASVPAPVEKVEAPKPAKKMKERKRNGGEGGGGGGRSGHVEHERSAPRREDNGEDGLAMDDAPAASDNGTSEGSADLVQTLSAPAGGAAPADEEATDRFAGGAPQAAPAEAPAPGAGAPMAPPPPPAPPRRLARVESNFAPPAPASTGTRERRQAASSIGDAEPAQSSSQPVGKIAAPDWTRQAGLKPGPADLDALRKAIAANPLDRGPRNSLAFALDRARANEELRDLCGTWQPSDPDNPMVYEYFGNAFTRLRDPDSALRAYSSIAEVSPGESGLLNRAGFLALKAGQHAMAETLFRFAIERRPDHANNYRGLALALWSAGKHEEAAKVLADAHGRDYHGRYGNLSRVLLEELGNVLAAWIEADPAAKPKADELAKRFAIDLARTDALRVTLHWETDANDVDLHVVDPSGEECYYSHRNNASGLNLYEDLTQGLGPEVATVPPGQLAKGVYHVGVKYFSAGPMGVSRGVVLVQGPSQKGKPDVQIETFCLLPDPSLGQDMRHVAIVER